MPERPVYLIVLKWVLVSNICWILYFTETITFWEIVVESMVILTATGSYVEYLMDRQPFGERKDR